MVVEDVSDFLPLKFMKILGFSVLHYITRNKSTWEDSGLKTGNGLKSLIIKNHPKGLKYTFI